MLTIDKLGAQSLLALLGCIDLGQPVSDSDLEATLEANRFFIDFYSGWEGSSHDILRQTVRYFNQPDRISESMVPARLAEGFRQGVKEIDLLNSRMAWLGEVDLAQFAGRILGLLPAHTPLDATIHLTVDGVNDAFVSQGGMGVSLLKGMYSREGFERLVSHELHHLCFRYWSAKDAVRQRLHQEHSGSSVAVMHVENLLMEGMANYYCTPDHVFTLAQEDASQDPFQARLARLRREETQFFSKAEDVLAKCLEPDAPFDPCLQAMYTIALDMEEMMLPACHYLGARMVQAMDLSYPRGQIVGCVQRLSDFLPLYNAAAREAQRFVFDADLVERFSQLLEG